VVYNKYNKQGCPISIFLSKWEHLIFQVRRSEIYALNMIR